ncbi:acetyltransferase, partial [Staphylococcus aureus]
MRKTDRYPVKGVNSLRQVYRTVPFFKVVKNFIFIQMARYTPFMGMKNWIYRTLLRMKV